MTQATVGARYQIVIPKTAREQVELRPHSKVDVAVHDGQIVISPLRPKRLRGIGKGLVKESPEDYVAKLRAEWESRQ